MADSNAFLILLKDRLPKAQKLARRRRQVLILFLDTVGLYLQAGFDLSYSWPEALKELRSSSPFLSLLEEIDGKSLVEFPSASGDGHGLGEKLKNLGETYPTAKHRLWFGVLRDLYQSGASLSDAVDSISYTLREEQQRELDAHFRTLPTRINVCLILFFLPATLALLFVPLVTEIIMNFR